VLAVLALNAKTGEIVFGPDIATRGFVFEEESTALLEDARAIVLDKLGEINAEAKTDQFEVKEEIRRALRRFFNKTLERRPVILPVIIEI
jgi:ribonuclease J